MPTTIVVGLLKDSPNMRARLQRNYLKVLQEKANQAHQYAINLAVESLHTGAAAGAGGGDRPSERRNLTFGRPHYADSFVVVVTENSRHRVRVELRNTSPVSAIIERGTKSHWISPVNGETLKFPVPTARRKQRSGFDRGIFAMNGPPWQHATAVKHPGGRKFQILLRTARAVRSGTVARGTGIPSGR